MERKKINIKLVNIKRFILSHLKQLYESHFILEKEINYLKHAYIN